LPEPMIATGTRCVVSMPSPGEGVLLR
jgi:hypothetical protein